MRVRDWLRGRAFLFGLIDLGDENANAEWDVGFARNVDRLQLEPLFLLFGNPCFFR